MYVCTCMITTYIHIHAYIHIHVIKVDILPIYKNVNKYFVYMTYFIHAGHIYCKVGSYENRA